MEKTKEVAMAQLQQETLVKLQGESLQKLTANVKEFPEAISFETTRASPSGTPAAITGETS